MKQKEIIAELKNGAYIRVHYFDCRRDRRRVYLVSSRLAENHRQETYRITHRQLQALYDKGIIRDDPEEYTVTFDKYGNRESYETFFL